MSWKLINDAQPIVSPPHFPLLMPSPADMQTLLGGGYRELAEFNIQVSQKAAQSRNNIGEIRYLLRSDINTLASGAIDLKGLLPPFFHGLKGAFIALYVPCKLVPVPAQCFVCHKGPP